jgi:hypothetical protein
LYAHHAFEIGEMGFFYALWNLSRFATLPYTFIRRPMMFDDDQVDEEYEELSSPEAQYTGQEVEALATIMAANDDDPAYMLGVLTAAMIRLMPEKHTVDEVKLRRLRECNKQIKDVMRLRRQWLKDYPELMRKLEARW